jgi:hypothetical protein
MNTSQSQSNKNQTRAQAQVSTPASKAKTIKLGIDAHLDRYVVVRITDGGTPQPPQRFEPAEFLLWVAKSGVPVPPVLGHTVLPMRRPCHSYAKSIRCCGPTPVRATSRVSRFSPSHV